VISVENCKIFPPRVFCDPSDSVFLGIRHLCTELKTRNSAIADKPCDSLEVSRRHQTWYHYIMLAMVSY